MDRGCGIEKVVSEEGCLQTVESSSGHQNRCALAIVGGRVGGSNSEAW